MKLSTIQDLCCLFDKNDLELTIISQKEDEIEEGYLRCKECIRIYPIIKGIPIMNPDEYREYSLEKPIFEKWGIELSTTFGIEKIHTRHNINHPSSMENND